MPKGLSHRSQLLGQLSKLSKAMDGGVWLTYVRVLKKCEHT